MKIHPVEAKLMNVDILGDWQINRHDKAKRHFLQLCKIYLKLFKYTVSFPRYFTVCITYQPPLIHEFEKVPTEV